MENVALEKARAEFAQVESNYISALEEKGLSFAARGEDDAECKELREELVKRGVEVRNAGASLSFGFLSPACIECTGNKGSETFSTTFKCHRDCYFCFNKNVSDYEKFFKEGCPWQEGLDRARSENDSLACIGLTGGEPLLQFSDSMRFLKEAHERFPMAHRRMYTSGDLLTEDMARDLRDVGLDEIRFSVKDDDSEDQQARVLNAMRIAKRYIPTVMVEMPIIPGAEDHMKELLREFAEIGIDGINMLEFCFPFSNWEDFSSRGFLLRNPPFEVMYDYGYSGGLAISGSEQLILKLMVWAIDEGLDIGFHYCSLENKHRSEIRIKNERASGISRCLTFDEGDFFLKCAQAYGIDAEVVKEALDGCGCSDYILDEAAQSISFPLGYLDSMRGMKRPDGGSLELQVCYFVYETEGDKGYLIDVALRDA